MTEITVFPTKCTEMYVAHPGGEPDRVSRSNLQAGSRARKYMFLPTPLKGVGRLAGLLGGTPRPPCYEDEIGSPKSGPRRPVPTASVEACGGDRDGHP